MHAWLAWTLQQFALPPMSVLDLDQWNMDGQTMLTLGEPDFHRRLPQGGDTVYAQFDMWRSNAEYHYPTTSCGMAPCYAPPPYPDYGWGPAEGSASPLHDTQVPHEPTTSTSTDTSFSDIAFMLQMLDHQNNPVGDPQTHYITPKTEPGYSPHQVCPKPSLDYRPQPYCPPPGLTPSVPRTRCALAVARTPQLRLRSGPNGRGGR